MIKPIQALLLLKGLLWIGLAILYIVNHTQSTPIPLWGVVTLFLINAFISIFLAWKMTTQKKIFFYAAVFFIVANIILTITDQLGVWDFVSLAIDVPTIILLMFTQTIFCRQDKK